MDIGAFYKQFCNEEFDGNGVLTRFEPVYGEHFNFAYDVVDAIARHDPGRRAMIWCSETGEERFFTFGDIKRYSDKAANMFRAHGITKGDMVMLVLKRHYQFWFSILALHKLGAVAINSSNMLTTKDYIYRFNAAEVDYIVATADGDVADSIDAACAEYGGIKAKFLVAGSKDARAGRAGWVDYNNALDAQSDSLERVETFADESLLMYFTSGTTGNPKMAYHDHSYPIGHISSAKYWHNIKPDGLHLTVADTGWAKASWGKIYGQWFVGAAIFVYDYTKFVPADLMAAIAKYRVTTFCAPPTIYRFFIKEGMESYDLSSITHATTAGEALNAEVFNRFYEYTGLKIMEAFGQSETTAVTVNLDGTEPRPGSMGRPSPLYDIALVDADDNIVPNGEIGELVIRVPEGKRQVGLFRGYYRDELKTREVWHGGLYHTGDTAWMDEDGYLWYVGRVDDVIKASGYRIGPFEIESVLMEHPAVMECAVTGASDPIRGTVVKATIVLTKAFEPSENLIKELQQYVKKQTAPYKYPRIIEFVDELPKTFSGKIKRADIRREDDKKAQAPSRVNKGA
ncbi:MAG: AMP-binding protein [Oscillospiraceae bacterium]|jgi:acetyl-CoA synthetase|nr:AMP-binding protein [Oscillospiraceae bacterium]